MVPYFIRCLDVNKSTPTSRREKAQRDKELKAAAEDGKLSFDFLKSKKGKG